MIVKTCTKCGETKSPECFGKHKEGALGLRPVCKDCCAAIEKARRLANPDAMREADRVRGRRERARRNVTALTWARNNPEKRKVSKAQWEAHNPHMRMVYTGQRRAAKLRATPAWADHEKIVKIYAEAAAMRLLGIDVHVDHVVPLISERVSGLHVHTNLRLLLASDNAAKGNRYWPDMP